MSSQKGILYLIQPCELIGTNRYKVGCSSKQVIDRCTDGYRKGSIPICIIKCNRPFDIENKIKQSFNSKFKLIAGKEFYQGDVDQMLNEFLKIWQESIEFKNTKATEEVVECKKYNEEDINEEDINEEIYEIKTYEEFIQSSKIEKIQITNKSKFEGYLKFPGQCWRKLYDKNRSDWDEDTMETLEGFIEHNCGDVYRMVKPTNELVNMEQKLNILYKYKNKTTNEFITYSDYRKLNTLDSKNFESIYNNNCEFIDVKFTVSEIMVDAANKCFVKNPEYYNLSYNEYVFWEPSSKLSKSNHVILDTKTFEYKDIDSLGDKIITGNQEGGRGLHIHGVIDTNMVVNILSSLLSSENINNFRNFAYKVFVEKSDDTNIFYDYNEKLLSTWLNDTVYTIAGNNYVVDSDSYYDDKTEFIENLKVRKPKCVFIYPSVKYSNGTTKKYKSAEKQIDDLKKLGCRNFVVKQDDKNINMYNLDNFRNYLKENIESITSLCETKGTKREMTFQHDDEIFYSQGLLQADFLKWCCTKP